MDKFSKVIPHIFEFEGGFVDHPDDPGGATNMGITIVTLRNLDMDLDNDGDIDTDDVLKVNRQVAEDIYRKQYWDVVEADKWHVSIGMVLMDGAVNSGPRASVRWAQKAMGITADGILGPQTRNALSRANPVAFVNAAVEERLKSVRQFRNYDVFGRGWENRIRKLRGYALELAK